MLNQVQIIGNLVRDVELRKTNNDISVTQFTVAVQKDMKNAEGEYESDFIDCVAWRNTAEYLSNYCKKGNRIAVSGRLQKRQFETENGTRYVTEVVVSNAYNLTPRDTVTRVESANDDVTPQSFMPDDSADLPF